MQPIAVLPRTSGLVQAALRRARAARTAVRATRRRVARLRSVRGRRPVFARVQSREPVGVSARPSPVDVPHAALAAASRAHRRARRQRRARVRATSSRRRRSSTCSRSSGFRIRERARSTIPSLASKAAKDLRYPVLVKANIGGSGAGIVRYETEAALAGAIERGEVELGIDGVALVQESAPLRDGHIVRVETLGGKYLYAIKVYPRGRVVRSLPGRRVPDRRRRRAGARRVRGRRAEDRPARRRLRRRRPRSSSRSRRSRAARGSTSAASSTSSTTATASTTSTTSTRCRTSSPIR